MREVCYTKSTEEEVIKEEGELVIIHVSVCVCVCVLCFALDLSLSTCVGVW